MNYYSKPNNLCIPNADCAKKKDEKSSASSSATMLDDNGCYPVNWIDSKTKRTTPVGKNDFCEKGDECAKDTACYNV